ncbi:MAG: hypothetical protein FD170_3712 [Bacteroidetes bacterium]|nr:MAG: hypothetical protein FD170_3712 [Bacteroidota bacterium]
MISDTMILIGIQIRLSGLFLYRSNLSRRTPNPLGRKYFGGFRYVIYIIIPYKSVL